MADYFSIHTTVRARPPRVPFAALKQKVLGSTYGVSLVFVGDARSQTLNRTYRGKDKRANVLAFPLSPNEGEIFLNLNQTRRDAPKFGLTFPLFAAKLFIHAMLHLKGYRHGGTMEHTEQAIVNTLSPQRNTRG